MQIFLIEIEIRKDKRYLLNKIIMMTPNFWQQMYTWRCTHQPKKWLCLEQWWPRGWLISRTFSVEVLFHDECWTRSHFRCVASILGEADLWHPPQKLNFFLSTLLPFVWMIIDHCKNYTYSALQYFVILITLIGQYRTFNSNPLSIPYFSGSWTGAIYPLRVNYHF